MEEKKEKKKFGQFSELTKLEMQLGFLWGILVGVAASWVFVMFFVKMLWYFKLFTSIGEVGIMGSIILGLVETTKARKNYISTMKEMEDMKAEADKVLSQKTESAPVLSSKEYQDVVNKVKEVKEENVKE